MLEIWTALAGLAAGFIGSFISGSQSLIALSSLLALGVPAHLSISIHRFGGLGFMSGGFFRFLQSNHIIWRYVLPATILSTLGVVIGTYLVLQINEEVLEKVMSIIILVFIPLTLWKRNLGVVKKHVSKAQEKIGFLIYFLFKIWSGVFPFGAGIFFSYIYLYFFGVTMLEMRATSRIPGFVSALAAAIYFIAKGVVDWKLGGIFIITNLCGAYIGAHYSIKVGNKFLQYLIMGSIGFLALKTLIF